MWNIKNKILEKNFRKSLRQLELVGERGVTVHLDTVDTLEKNLNKVRSLLAGEINNLTSNKFQNPEILRTLQAQYQELSQIFLELPKGLREELGKISKNDIKIALFGRTMAGKSTLMEIFTHGSGISIGKGSQRTTRDIRTYTYQGITIVDLPGIGAFEGQEDTDLAFVTAKSCDLILFLMTDDAPQEEEAACFARLLELGKPIISLMNIQCSWEEGKHLDKLFELDLKKNFKQDRLEAIRQQFLEFATRYEQDWSEIPFTYVHLKAGFLAQNEPDKSKAARLRCCSRMEELDKQIQDLIAKNGDFYKINNYTACLVPELESVSQSLLLQSYDNYRVKKLLVEKEAKFQKTIENFQRHGTTVIKNFVGDISATLKSEIPRFSENNCESSSVGDKWNQLVTGYKLEESATSCLEQLGQQALSELKEISSELEYEINFTEKIGKEFNARFKKIVNVRQICGWTSAVGTIGLAIATATGIVASTVALPVTIATVVVGLLGGLFGDKKAKREEARKKLEEQLLNNVDELSGKLLKDLQQNFEKQVVKQCLVPFSHFLQEWNKNLARLIFLEQTCSQVLFEEEEKENMWLLAEALQHNKETLPKGKLRILRVVGTEMLCLQQGRKITERGLKKLNQLLPEPIMMESYEEDWGKAIENIIAVTADRIRVIDVQDKPYLIELNLQGIKKPESFRVRMLQQITSCMVVDKKGEKL